MKKTWFRRVLLLVLIILFLISAPVFAQANAAVVVSDIKGQRMENLVLVNGAVTNTLPWPVSNIQVMVVFKGTSVVGTTTIEKLSAGEKKTFVITEQVPLGADQFVTFVGAYSVISNNVNALLEKYDQAENDPALQSAIPQAFGSMTDAALPALLECVDTTLRPDQKPSLLQTTHDLMCLDGLRTVGGPDAASAVLDLLAWYDAQNALELQDIFMEILVDEFSPLRSFPILKNLPILNIGMVSVTKIALKDIGTASVPALLHASHDSSPVISRTARDILIDLNKTSVADILNEQDRAVWILLVDYYQQYPDPETVRPVMQLSHFAEGENDLAKIESCVLSNGSLAIAPLIDTLSSPYLDVANRAESLLYKLAPGHEDVLKSHPLGQSISLENLDSAGIIKALRAEADARIEAVLQELYQSGVQEFNSGNCLKAVQVYSKMFSYRNPLPAFEKATADAYACQITIHSNAEQYAKAISLAEDGLRYMPENQTLLDVLTGIYQLRANESYKSGQHEEARRYWNEILLLDPNNRTALAGIGLIRIQANQDYLLVGAIGLLGLVAFAAYIYSEERYDD